jgi:molecular chaperone DnaJ
LSTRTVQARIPAGVKDGARIRLKGKGAPGERGGQSGDLYVVVHVTSHPVFGRKGDNLTVTVPITFTEATLGGQVVVPTPGGGTVTLKIPAGTANGRTFRVRGKGVTRKDGTKGDLLATVEVRVPADLSDEAREALQKYAEATAGEDPRADLLAAAKG